MTNLPQIGDKVSYSFNGDYRPCGVIVKIGKNMKRITTSEGLVFNKKSDRNCWMIWGYYSLVNGHIDRTNMEF
jgi:hypothetical protein